MTLLGSRGLQQCTKTLDGGIDLTLGDRQRWQQADCGGPRCIHDEPLFEQRPPGELARVLDLEREHQPTPAGTRQTCREALALCGDISEEGCVVDRVEN